MQLNQYNRLFFLFGIVIWGTFPFHLPTFYRESFSFFLSAKLIPWYKSFFWFLYIKALLSPSRLDCQPNLFVKRSLNLDGYLFSCAWNSLSISFALSPSASNFIFVLRERFSQLEETRTSSAANNMSYLPPCHLNHQYFFSAWKFLFVRGFSPLFLSFYYRCIDIYHPFPLQFSFYFFVKTTLILYLTSNFFFLRENHSLFFILFLDKAHFYNGASLLFLYPVFFFFFVKSSLRSLLRSSYIWHCCVPCCSFLCLREIFSQ